MKRSLTLLAVVIAVAAGAGYWYVHGKLPQREGEVLIASKHQSFFDIILICSVVPRPKFIMKKELRWTPLMGFYAWRIGCIPVDRGKKGRASDEVEGLVHFRSPRAVPRLRITV